MANCDNEAGACSACDVADRCLAVLLKFTGQTGSAIPRRSVDFRRRSLAVQEGATVHNFIVVRRGWAAKFDLFPDGRRQIFDLLLPGDTASCEELISEHVQSSVIALSDLQTCQFARHDIMRKLMSSPDLLMAFNRICAAYPRRMRAQLSAVGRQSAEARIATLILNVRDRVSRPNQRAPDTIPFYLRQQDIADILGLTQVHVSRVLRALRDRKIIDLKPGELLLSNAPELTRISNG